MVTIEERCECLNFVKNLEINAFKKYLNEIGFKDNFAYNFDYRTRTFTIYTSKPGYWIGYKGKGAKRLKEILSEVYEDCNIEFKEIRGSFVSVE